MNLFFNKIIDIISYTISNRISIILNIVLLPLITPYLTLEDFGLFGIYSSILFILSSMVPVGQNLYIENSFFTHKEKYLLVWRRSLSVMNYVSFLYIIIFSLIVYLIFDSNIFDLSILLISGSIYIFCNSYDGLLRSFHIYNNKSVIYLKKNALKAIIISIVTYVFIVIFDLGYLGWVISMGLSQLINIFVFYNDIISNKFFPFHSFKKKWFLKNIKETSKLIPYQISSQIINLSDKILLKFFNINIDIIGMYSQGYNFGYNAKSLNNGIFSALAVTIQKNFRSQNYRDLGFLFKNIFILFSVASLIFQLWTRDIFLILFRKPEFLDSHLIAGLIFSSITFFVSYEFLNGYLFINEKPKKISIIGLIVAIFNVSFNIVFIPKYGIYATIFSSYVTHLLMSLSFLIYKETRIVYSKMIQLKKLILLISCHLILSLTLYFYVESFNYTFKIIITIILLLMIYNKIKILKS